MKGTTPSVWWALLLVPLALLVANIGRLPRSSTEPSMQPKLSEDPELAKALPQRDVAASFASSESCRTCHPQEYASWHASYHRQMTQVARVETILGPFDGTTVEDAGRVHRLVRRGDELWVESSPVEGDTAGAASGSAPTRDASAGGTETAAGGTETAAGGTSARRVVMTTGAHHMQICWTSSGKGNLLDELPVIYIRDDLPGGGRWAPLEASYLSPSPAGAAQQTHWNRDCILCHATGGKPGLDQEAGSATTKVADLGIACEACHGPGERHVRLHRDRTANGSGEPGAEDDVQAIINPPKLRPERSAQVCGHCHSLASFQTDQLTEDFFHAGSPFRPGDDLLQTRMTVLPAHMSAEQIEAHQRYNPFFDGSYWPDGMVRVAGREYNGLLESTCYQKGGMTCLSCHSMHQSEPNDQLSSTGGGNEACFQCHASYRDNLAAHTHHSPGSTGSLCYNCHMPHTTYGLFKAIRSHQISSPNVAVTLSTGRLAACNLCHLDQTLAWTASKLAQWYGQPAVEVDDERRTLSAAAVGLTKGDPVQRVLLGWIAGWRPSLECGAATLAGQTQAETEEGAAQPGSGPAAGNHWLAPLLALLLEDESPVIRLVAWRSLRSLDARYAVNFDFVASAPLRAEAARQVVERWQAAPLAERSLGGERVLIKPDGQLDRERIETLLKGRDQSQLRIQE